MDVGETVEIRRVDESEPERLRYLAMLGLVPGVVVTLCDRQPFGGPVTVESAGERHIIGAELAQVVLVAAAEDSR
jgi:DtxR family Mn-dependent transcriptional regulator